MKIDLHTHVLPENWPNLKQKYGYSGWLEIKHSEEDSMKAKLMKDTGEFFRMVKSNCWDTEQRLAEMNDTKVDIQVLSTVPVMFNYWAKPEDTLDFARFLNDDIAHRVSLYPDRFVALGSIPLQDPILSVEELKRIKLNYNFPGVQIGSHFNNFTLGDAKLDPFYSTCQDLNISIFVHPWDMQLGPRWSKFWLPWLVGMPSETSHAIVSVLMGGVLMKFPNLKFCFAHGAGSFPYTLGRISHGYKVRPDLCAQECSVPPEQFVGKFYADSLVHDEKALEFLINVLGQDSICLGSDYPFPLGEERPGKLIDESPLSEDVKEKLMSKNAKQFLGLNEI